MVIGSFMGRSVTQAVLWLSSTQQPNYSGNSVERKIQSPGALMKNASMTCPSYPEGSSTTVFALKTKKQKRYTFLSAPIDLVQVKNLIQIEDQDHPHKLRK
jgi:hypothetical protein